MIQVTLHIQTDPHDVDVAILGLASLANQICDALLLLTLLVKIGQVRHSALVSRIISELRLFGVLYAAFEIVDGGFGRPDRVLFQLLPAWSLQRVLLQQFLKQVVHVCAHFFHFGHGIHLDHLD